MSFVFTARQFADHIHNICGLSKGRFDYQAVEEALNNYATTQVELVISGRYLTDAQKDEWLRCNEWSGI